MSGCLSLTGVAVVLFLLVGLGATVVSVGIAVLASIIAGVEILFNKLFPRK